MARRLTPSPLLLSSPPLSISLFVSPALLLPSPLLFPPPLNLSPRLLLHLPQFLFFSPNLCLTSLNLLEPLLLLPSPLVHLPGLVSLPPLLHLPLVSLVPLRSVIRPPATLPPLLSVTAGPRPRPRGVFPISLGRRLLLAALAPLPGGPGVRLGPAWSLLSVPLVSASLSSPASLCLSLVSVPPVPLLSPVVVTWLVSVTVVTAALPLHTSHVMLITRAPTTIKIFYIRSLLSL